MSFIRDILGFLILLADRLFPGRSAAQIQEAPDLKLYEFRACPFCVKVRRHLRKIGVKLETRNVLANADWERELIDGGKMRQVPCLRIEEGGGKVRWLYESSDIIAFLNQRYCRRT